MKYAKQERMDIVNRVCNRELTIAAAVQNDLNISSIKGYFRFYWEANSLPSKAKQKSVSTTSYIEKKKGSDMKEYGLVSKEVIIEAPMMARINEAHLKIDIQ